MYFLFKVVVDCILIYKFKVIFTIKMKRTMMINRLDTTTIASDIVSKILSYLKRYKIVLFCFFSS